MENDGAPRRETVKSTSRSQGSSRQIFLVVKAAPVELQEQISARCLMIEGDAEEGGQRPSAAGGRRESNSSTTIESQNVNVAGARPSSASATSGPAEARLLVEMKRPTSGKVPAAKPAASKREGHAQPLAASVQLIRSGTARPLRQIDIVGQLNHSARRGLLTLVNLIALVVALALAMAHARHHQAGATIWPFGAKTPLSGLTRPFGSASSSIWPVASSVANSTSTSAEPAGAKRAVRDNSGPALMAPSAGQQQMASPAPISRQFHYFWNHDQINERTLAEEAQKIIGEAQRQTDEIALAGPVGLAARSERRHSAGDLAGAASNSNSSASADPLGTSASSTNIDAIVPAAIQQQLTAMVLQMQRQQQMSSLMQPRFDSAIVPASEGANHAQRRLSTTGAQLIAAPMNPMSRFWMAAASSQQPVVAMPPAGPPFMGGAEPQLSAATMGLFGGLGSAGAGMATGGPPMQPRASLAGVPIYGPFMVAPSAGLPVARHFGPVPIMQPASGPSKPVARHQPASSGSRFTSSLFGRHRKAWPLFGGAGTPSSGERHDATAASQPRPTVVMPPLQQQAPPPGSIAAQTARALAVNLPPESLALIETATNQLANMIVGQMQARSTQQQQQQQLVAAMAATAAAAASLAANQNGRSGGQQASLQHEQERSFGSIAGALADQMQASSSSPPASLKLPDQTFSLSGSAQDQKLSNEKQALEALPPYLLATRADLNLANSILDHYGAYNQLQQQQQQQQQQMLDVPSQSFELANLASLYDNSTNFGSRLKRRTSHASLNSQLDRNSVPASATTSNQRKPLAPYASLGVEQDRHSLKSAPGVRENSSTSKASVSAATNFDEIEMPNHMNESRSSALVAAGNRSSRQARQLLQKQQHKHSAQPQKPSKSQMNLRQQLLMIVTTESPMQSMSSRLLTVPKSALPSAPSVFTMTPDNSHELDELRGQTQLRRLKRSAGPTARKLRSISLSSTSDAGSGWKSMSEELGGANLSPARVKSISFAGEPTKSFHDSDWAGAKATKFSSSSWRVNKAEESFKPMAPVGDIERIGTSISRTEATHQLEASSAAVLRRQAELTSNSSATQQQAARQAANELVKLTPAPDRQERALKNKRPPIASSGPLMQHGSSPAMSGFKVFNMPTQHQHQQQSLSGGQSRHTLTTSKIYPNLVPTSSAPPAHTSSMLAMSASVARKPADESSGRTGEGEKLSTTTENPAADPMAASLSESARVVNYFANVDNEPKATPAATATTTARPLPSNHEPAPHHQPQQHHENIQAPPQGPSSGPAINVGFPAPSKVFSQQSAASSKASENLLMGPLNGTNSGNSGANGLNQFGPGAGLDALQQQQQMILMMQQQLANRQQRLAAPSPSLALAGSADISSAATGNLAYAIQQSGAGSGANNGAFSLPSGLAGSQAASQMQRPLGRPMSPFSMAQKTNLLSTLFALDPTKRSSTGGAMSPFSAPPVQHQHQQLAEQQPQQKSSETSARPQSSSLKQHSSTSGMDRAPMGDQFNEDFMQAPQPQGQPSGFPGEQSMSSGATNGDHLSQNSAGGAFADQNSQQADQSLLMNGQQQAQTQFGADQNFGVRNSANNQQLSDQSMSSLSEQQAIELSRFHGQQQQQEQQQQQQQPSASSQTGPNQSGFGGGSSEYSSSGEVTSNGMEALNGSPGPSESHSLQQFGQNSLAPSGVGGQSFSSSPPEVLGATGFPSSLGQSSSPSDIQLMTAQSQALLNSNQNQQMIDGTSQAPSSAPMMSWQSLQTALANNRISMQLEDALALRNALVQSQLTQAASSGSLASSSAIDRQFFAHMGGAEQAGQMSSLLASGPESQSALFGAGSSGSGPVVDEESAANAAAAAGIPTYPNAAQLLAIQAHGHLLGSGQHRHQALMMAGSERSSSDFASGAGKGNGRGGAKGKPKGKGKKSEFKHVSHHYHFNSLGSPLEDPDAQFTPPLGSLEFAANIAANEQAQAALLSRKKQKLEEEEREKKKQQQQQQQEEEEEKPKRKRSNFLRRFSIKNLFKRFRKEKKEPADEQAGEEQASGQQQGDSSSSSSSSSSQADGSQERAIN